MSHTFKVAFATFALCAGGTAVAAPSYTSSVFATAPTGASGPDSVTVGAGSVWISYDGSALTSDGTQPAGVSTIVRYSPTGAVQNTFQIGGDVDGLKYNPATNQVWALQNQDARSSLTLIDAATNTLTQRAYAVVSTTQGYDDVAFNINGTFLSYTNPAAATDVTLQQVTSTASPITVKDLLTAGTPGQNRVTGQPGYVPTTANTDSLKTAPNGDLVQTTGARNTLAFVRDAGLATQSVSYLPLSANGAPVTGGLDDSLFLTSGAGTIYASITNANSVLAINYAGVTPGTLVGAIGGALNEIGVIAQSTGVVTPFVTGLSGVHGLDVVPMPEPTTLALLSAGLLSALGLRRRR